MGKAATARKASAKKSTASATTQASLVVPPAGARTVPTASVPITPRSNKKTPQRPTSKARATSPIYCEYVLFYFVFTPKFIISYYHLILPHAFIGIVK